MIFGKKSDRDIKEVTPVINKIKEEYSRISKLSNDGLREESDRLKNIIDERIKAEEDEIAKLKAEAEEAEGSSEEERSVPYRNLEIVGPLLPSDESAGREPQ